MARVKVQLLDVSCRGAMDRSANVSGYFETIRPECSDRLPAIDGWDAQSHSGSTALMNSGSARGGPATDSYDAEAAAMGYRSHASCRTTSAYLRQT